MQIQFIIKGLIMKHLTSIFNSFSLLKSFISLLSKLKKQIFSFLVLIFFFSSTAYAATINVRISAGNDDAEEEMVGNSIDRGSSDLELAYESNRQQIGMRFRNITIPNGASISNAYIQFSVDEFASGTTNLVIYGQNANNPGQFQSADSDISNRTTTTANVNWNNVPAWLVEHAKGTDQRTPNISTIIQEIVDRGGWNSGNNLVILIKPGAGCNNTNCRRTAESYNGSSGEAPELVIEYFLAEIPPIMNAIPDQTATKDDPYSLAISSYTTQTNGDAISSYNLTGSIPAGLSFDPNTGDLTGTPTVAGTFTLNATATDNDGTSNSATFDLVVTAAPLTCTDYDSSNHSDPGRVITSMDQITASKQRCISGVSAQSDGSTNKRDYYLFTVQVDGTLDITTNSPNNHEFYLRVGSSFDGTQYYGDNTAENHNVSTIALNAGNTIYVHVRETGDNSDQYEIHFNFISANPAPIANAGTDQYIEVGDDATLDASASTDDGSIVSYAWSTGDTGTSPTISGLPVGIHTITLTVTDNEGATGTDTVNIVVSGPGNDTPVIISNGGGDNASITVTSSQTHVTNVHAIDPDGDVITYSISGGADAALFTINTTTGVLSLSSSGTPGDSYVVIVEVTDPDGASDTQTITVIVDDPLVMNVGDRPFTVRNPPNTRNIRGNYVIGGNMNLCEDDGTGHCKNNNSNSNSHDDIYIDIDIDPNTLNSTSFDLNLPTNANILWAGLYWQGVIHRSRAADGGNDFMGGTVPSNAPLLGGSTNQIDLTNNTYGAEIVKFKLPGANDYIDIVANQLDYSRLGYSGFANVTSYIDSVNFNGTYTLADLKCHEGAEPNHGNYGGWALVVIYSQADEQFKNITLFDGFATVDSNYNDSLTINGFLTPKNPPIESKIAFFTMDGEGGTNYLRVISNKVGGAGTKISGPNNPPNSLFNSTIQGVNNRQPNLPSLRMDLDIIDLVDVLVPSESGATLEPRTSGDRFTPSFFIMSSDLIAPELCYDYDLHVGNAKVSSEDRHIDTSTRGANIPLQINVLIRSMVADFDFEQAKSYISFIPDANITQPNAKPLYSMGSSEVSPAGINAYLPVLEINGSTRGLIGIGHNIFENQENENGGIINPNESTYYKQNFDFPDDRFQGRFDIHIEGYVDYLQDGNPFYFPLSTRDSSISRCPINQTYNAIEGNFNIENAVTAANAPSYDRYPLYTQVAGKEYEIVLASYTKDANDDFTVPTNSNMTLDIELIDAGVFDNNASTGYDSTCEKPPTTPVSIGFIKFNNNNRVLFNPSDYLAYDNTVAIRNAAFRIWILTTKNINSTDRIMLEHNCANAEDYNCFEPIYDTQYKNAEDNTTQYCTALCNPALRTDDSQCYNCLKKYFAVPLCSRDNFSIRPEAFSIAIGDNGDPHDTAIETTWFASNFSIPSDANTSLAAGYEYPLEVNATIYDNQLTLAKRYHTEDTNKFEKNTYLNPNLPNEHSYISLAALQFNNSVPNCADSSHSTLELKFTGSQLDGNHFLQFNNVGKYTFAVSDSAWTEVDQARFPFKTDFGNGKHNECDINSFGLLPAINTQVGCTISSTWSSKTKMELDFKPYKYDMSSIVFTNAPTDSLDFLYMNDLNANRNMAIKFEGNITAKGKNNIMLSNFTGGCAAEDVEIWLDRTMIPQEETIRDEDNITKIDFQQALNDNSGYTITANTSSNDINSTLGKTNFVNTIDLNGTSPFDLSFNFEKPYGVAVNPIDVNFSMLHVASPTALSNANLVVNHMADANSSINQNRYFYYARILAIGADNKQVTGLNFNTALIVQTYCDNNSVLNCTLIPNIVQENGAWYRVSDHTTAGNYGSIARIDSANNNVTFDNAGVLNNVTFDTNGSTASITIEHPMAGRPASPEIIIDTDPWLYHSTTRADGRPSFTPDFLIQGLRWKGAGTTGNVVETEPTTIKSERMSW